jgi:hypothetical protein
VKTPHRISPQRRLETWLWTGPVGHFVGVGLDLLQALIAYRRKRRAGGAQRVG